MGIELEKKGSKKKEQQQSLSSTYSKNIETEKFYQLYTREFSALNADNIKFYFDAAQKGINFFKAFLFEEIRRRDLRIGAICQTRKLGVLDSEWMIEGTNQQHVDFLKENYARVNFRQFLSDIIEAQLQGMSIFQLFYEFSGTKQLLSDIALIPNYLIYNKNEIQFVDFSKTTIYDLRAQVQNDMPVIPTITLDEMYFLETYSFDGNAENGLQNGIIDSMIWGYFFKSYGLKDWSVFLERFAMPSVIGKYDPLMNKTDRAILEQAVKEFGNWFRATIPNTASIDFSGDTSKQSSGTLYESYLKYWNDELSIRALGQAQTTDTSEGGSFAKAKVGDIVRKDYQRGDKALIVSVVNALNKKLLALNFANIGEYPVFKFVESENIDYKLKKAELIVKLKQSGFDADEKEVSEIFGFGLKKSQTSVISNQLTEFADARLWRANTSAKKQNRSTIEEYLLELWATLE